MNEDKSVLVHAEDYIEAQVGFYEANRVFVAVESMDFIEFSQVL